MSAGAETPTFVLSAVVEVKRSTWNAAHPHENRCTKLLLGKAEQKVLIQEAESWGYFKKPDILFERTDSCRVEYRGLLCYAVDDDSYCEVAL